MTTAEASPGDFATRGDLELVRRDLKHTGERLSADMRHMEGQLRSDMQHMEERFGARAELTEERLRADMHQLEVRLIRWIGGTLLAAAGVGAALATAVTLLLG